MNKNLFQNSSKISNKSKKSRSGEYANPAGKKQILKVSNSWSMMHGLILKRKEKDQVLTLKIVPNKRKISFIQFRRNADLVLKRLKNSKWRIWRIPL
jgi:hypothetical protein